MKYSKEPSKVRFFGLAYSDSMKSMIFPCRSLLRILCERIAEREDNKNDWDHVSHNEFKARESSASAHASQPAIKSVVLNRVQRVGRNMS